MSNTKPNIQEKYNNCPDSIKEVIDLLLDWYADMDAVDDDDTDVDLIASEPSERFLIKSSLDDATDTRVVGYTLCGNHCSFDNTRKNNWASFMEEIGNLLDNKDSAKMFSLGETHYKFLPNGKRPAITNYLTREQKTAKGKKHYRQLRKSKAYICTNYDNNGKLEFLYSLIKEFGYNDSDLVIEVEKIKTNDSKLE